MGKGLLGALAVGALGLVVLLGGTGCGGSGSASGTNTTGVTTTTGTVTSYSATVVASSVAGVIPSGLNDSNEVCGGVFPSSGTNSSAFTWSSAGGYAALALPGSVTSFSFAADVNNSGVIVGYGANSGGHSRAVVWTGGVPKDIGDLGGGIALAQGINAAGQVVGYSYDSSGNLAGFEWTASGGMTNLTGVLGGPNQPWAINNSGVITGGTGDSAQDGFVYSTSLGFHTIGDFGGGTSVGRAINASNEVVGLAQDAGNANRAFSWTVTGGLKRLAEPSGTSASAAYDVNASGLIVGSVVTTAAQACAWLPSGSIELLTPMATGLPTGVTLTYAQAVNTQGVILAFGSDSNAYLLTPVFAASRHSVRP